ncbi:LytR C-terminal domain-containing protein [Fusobacterium sp. IOR10]|uniref:LytR C-terminal domain-containing protein n=1 Tax=Fusobacterium sp. IOR10 TaxID=2665157 RepID=UPI0013CFFD18|nr:LytR C-terminal domain-containing protein [Fusobacterium sp. IOR10]
MDIRKKASRVKYTLLGAVIFLIAVLVLIYSVLSDNKETEKLDRYALIGKENIFLVYEDRLAIKIPFEIQIDKDVSFKELVKVRNYEEILKRINLIFPEKIEKYKKVKYGEMDLKVKNARNVPEVMINDKRHILTSSIEPMFEDLYRDKKTSKIDNKSIVVDILNANGKPGHARRTGEKLKSFFGLKYNAANYETNSQFSYIVINDLHREKIEDILMQVNEKYFKIKEDATIPTLANVVIILGKESKKIFDVEVLGQGEIAKKYVKALKSDGYNSVIEKKTKISGTDIQINYNKEDYYTAYKIAKKLGINKMIQRDELKNKIVVIAN